MLNKKAQTQPGMQPQQVVDPSMQGNVVAQPKKKSKAWLWILFFIFILIVLGGTLGYILVISKIPIFKCIGKP